MNHTFALDLGCGASPKNPFRCSHVFGIDIDCSLSSDSIRVADLNVEPIPFGSSSIDVVTAFDFIEHVPRLLYAPHRLNPFILLMNEVSRVLRPGGIFFHSTPCYPHASAFQDPTHVNIVTSKTFLNYFSVGPDHRGLAKMYGYVGRLILLTQYIHNGSHLRCTMQKEPLGDDLSLFASSDYLHSFEDLVNGKT
jgi:SAM-dependent methyltransferase